MAHRAVLALAAFALACSESKTDAGLEGASASQTESAAPTNGSANGPTATDPATPPNATPPGVTVPPTGTSPSVSAGAGGEGSDPAGGGGAEPVPTDSNGAGGSSGGTAGSGAGGDAAVQDGGRAGSSGGAAAGGAPPVANPAVIDDLTTYLEEDIETRSPIDGESFATAPLTREQAEAAQALLWNDHVERIRAEREAENNGMAITLGDYTLRYAFTTFGEAPTEGRSLFISLHGGGETDAATNDGQWENQQVLYEPAEGIYLSPRAPTDTWNMWHQDHIDPLFTRLIENLIVFEGVNPNRVYVMGYSAGGDGVYQLGPRMADYWAAAAMMAGHPNDAEPLSLRNIGFAIHVGELDTAFERNAIAADWGLQLDALQDSDPEGYEHQVEVHAGKPHWMDLEDAVAVPWMEGFTRDPIPTKVIWLQDDAPHERFYWLRLSEADWAAGVLVEASYEGQTVTVEGTELEGQLEVMLSDAMVDLDEPVSIVTQDGEELFSGMVDRTIADIARTLVERGDPASVYSGKVRVTLP